MPENLIVFRHFFHIGKTHLLINILSTNNNYFKIIEQNHIQFDNGV